MGRTFFLSTDLPSGPLVYTPYWVSAIRSSLKNLSLPLRHFHVFTEWHRNIISVCHLWTDCMFTLVLLLPAPIRYYSQNGAGIVCNLAALFADSVKTEKVCNVNFIHALQLFDFI